MLRRRFKQTVSLEERLASEAKRLEKKLKLFHRARLAMS